MRTLQDAAALLAAAHDADGLAPLARALGFADPDPLDASALASLGLDEIVARARVARGGGTMRALLVELPAGRAWRDALTGVAARLSARAPQLLWLLLATERGGHTVSIAAWTPEYPRPRVAALVADRRRVLPSDAESVRALAAATGDGDLVAHARWVETLGREALTRRFYRALERVVESLAGAVDRAPHEDRRELAFLIVSRLIFLSFLETKGWLARDHRFLERGFERCAMALGGYHRTVLRPLFFGTLNTARSLRSPAARAFGDIPFLNGGLFAPAPVERRWRATLFPDEALALVFDELLGRYRFTAREERADWSEAAIDPEMMGKAFESLMQGEARRDSGAFYTPHTLVRAVTRAALVDALSARDLPSACVARALDGGAVENPVAMRARVERLAILDPACGSGAFLVHALEEIAGLLGRMGDRRPAAALRRDVLARSIFGVDASPTAVWLCELRLWLSVVIESTEGDPNAVAPLPNLDRHIRVGDSLAGAAWEEGAPIGGAKVARMRERYARATGARKRTLAVAFERAERGQALAIAQARVARLTSARRELLSALRGRDLFGRRRVATAAERAFLDESRARLREGRAECRRLSDGGALPFCWIAAFPDVAAAGGFDVVLGNPPWVRLHRIPAGTRAALRSRFAVYGGAAWARGAALAGAGSGFGAQVDLAALFAERSLALLRQGGTLALLLPAKLWRALAGGGVRRLLADRARLVAIEDWSEAPPAFDAAVYPSLLVARRAAPDDARGAVAVSRHRRAGAVRWCLDERRLALDDDPASPWLVMPAPVRDAFDRLTSAGAALADTHLGRPALGVKCGCNEAFVVRLLDRHGELATVSDGARTGLVERALLRPVIRGAGAGRSGVPDEWILWTHAPGGAPLDRLPPHAARWLAPWQRRLRSRADARRGGRWWSLFRTAGAASGAARVVWADLAVALRPLVLAPRDPAVPLNSCYVLPCRDPREAHALAALLASPLLAAWLAALAEPARGGFRRHLAWTVALAPIPRDWHAARDLLAPLAARDAGPDELLGAAMSAYGLRPRDVEPLLAWSAS